MQVAIKITLCGIMSVTQLSKSVTDCQVGNDAVMSVTKRKKRSWIFLFITTFNTNCYYIYFKTYNSFLMSIGLSGYFFTEFSEVILNIPKNFT